MPRGPSAKEISSFLKEVRDNQKSGGDPAVLASRKAELLEGIAAAHPGDREAARVAKAARAKADRSNGR
ncbi:hypothetical protein [Streptomyces sp. SID3343]|uniref:hypothetical protein n=1 Tax=Streptomyces sp. SID3343 TaxID=2690260 RepID=UPI001371B4C9|nr:hypothetical protein [Streptomyces sp. SID3343]MYW04509.1 hypothetical protein [Streptomyces sp. SID3343]